MPTFHFSRTWLGPCARRSTERPLIQVVSQRIFKYASKWDFLAYAAGVVASIGAGITLPLMNVVFGT